MINLVMLCLLTLFGSVIGTATGFGTSTVMIPVMVLFVPPPIALLFVGIVHLCGDIWKVLLFKRGFDWSRSRSVVVEKTADQRPIPMPIATPRGIDVLTCYGFINLVEFLKAFQGSFRPSPG